MAKDTVSGGAKRQRAGLVPIDLSVTPEVRAIIGVAAKLAGRRSMAEFSREAVEREARKILKDHGLRPEKILAKNANGA